MTTDEFMELMKVLRDVDKTMRHLAQVVDKLAVKLELPETPRPVKK